MAYFASKLLAGLFGLCAVFGLSGANVGFYNPQPSTGISPANRLYEGLEQPPEALQGNVEATTTTITTIAGCDDVVNLAQALGWPVDKLPTLRYIASAESRCMPWAHNATDPHTGSYGIMQINGFWCTPNSNWPTGWLQAQGVLTTCDDLFNATINLQAAKAIQDLTGWQAWATFTGN